MAPSNIHGFISWRCEIAERISELQKAKKQENSEEASAHWAVAFGWLKKNKKA
jgi:hypothetical protein